MEDGEGPPPKTAVTSDISNTPAPPYPGPPLDSRVVTNQTRPVHPAAQNSNQPVAQLVAQQYTEHGQQPVMQYIPQQNQNVQQVNQVVVMVQQRPTETPGNMTCPHCKCSVVTTIEHKLGALTWIIIGVLFIFGFWPCCLIPFFVDSCKDVHHSCPQCNNVLHIYKRM